MLKLLLKKLSRTDCVVQAQGHQVSLFRTSYILALCIALTSLQSGAAEHRAVLRVDIAVFEYPPLYHTAKSGKFSGLIGETLKQICAEADLDCRFQMRPVSRAYAELERAEVQGLVTVNFKRFKTCCFESKWQYPWKSGLYSKLPVSIIPSNLAGMAGDGVIIVQGWQSPYSYFDDLEGAERRGDLQVHRANSSIAALRMLDRDRAVYLWGGGEFQWYIQQKAIAGLHFKPLMNKPMVLWVTKESPEIAKRFDSGYQSLQAKGLLDTNNLLIEHLMVERYEDP